MLSTFITFLAFHTLPDRRATDFSNIFYCPDTTWTRLQYRPTHTAVIQTGTTVTPNPGGKFGEFMTAIELTPSAPHCHIFNDKFNKIHLYVSKSYNNVHYKTPATSNNSTAISLKIWRRSPMLLYLCSSHDVSVFYLWWTNRSMGTILNACVVWGTTSRRSITCLFWCVVVIIASFWVCWGKALSCARWF